MCLINTSYNSQGTSNCIKASFDFIQCIPTAQKHTCKPTHLQYYEMIQCKEIQRYISLCHSL